MLREFVVGWLLIIGMVLYALAAGLIHLVVRATTLLRPSSSKNTTAGDRQFESGETPVFRRRTDSDIHNDYGD